ncbi:MAG TPA: fluoride efflux transporter CrcB [Sporichthyaceae bacterium]
MVEQPRHPIDPQHPVDPDTGPSPRSAAQGPVVLAVSVGGVIGALARYGAGRAWHDGPAQFPWTTLGINVLGCVLIGVLMVLVTERAAVHDLWRPLLGTGVLGGFTTFSTYTVDLQRALAADRWGQAVGYGTLTVAGALAGVAAATTCTRLLGVRA